MPNPSNASGARSSDPERKSVAEALYLERGASAAETRCDLNAQLGAFDLGDAILARLALQPGECVLDVGCGAGQHLARFAEAVGSAGHALGSDFNPEAVAKTQARGLEACVASMDALPYTPQTAHALSCNYAIYYLPDLTKTLFEWRRVLKPGGRVVITGPAADTNAELYAFHKRATGADPSDADTLALGYVQHTVPPQLTACGFTEVTVEVLTNPITFPDREAFLEYWVNTSLFARTPVASRAQGEAALADHTGPVVITKRVALVTARRS